jgi:hypothetical protein
VQYLGTCLICEEEKIRSMLRQARPIRNRALYRAIGAEGMSAWAQAAGGGDLERDRKEARYYRSHYDVLPCVFIAYRRVRHIFI